MIRIDPNTFYSHEELRVMFAEIGMNWNWFRAQINPRKVSGKAYWGADLIRAIEAAPLTSEREHGLDKPVRPQLCPKPTAKGKAKIEPMLARALKANGLEARK